MPWMIVFRPLVAALGQFKSNAQTLNESKPIGFGVMILIKLMFDISLIFI